MKNCEMRNYIMNSIQVKMSVISIVATLFNQNLFNFGIIFLLWLSKNWFSQIIFVELLPFFLYFSKISL